MRNTCRITAVLFLLLLGIADVSVVYTAEAAQAAAGHAGQVTTNGDRLTMRSSPNPKSTALGTLANGTTVTIVTAPP